MKEPGGHAVWLGPLSENAVWGPPYSAQSDEEPGDVANQAMEVSGEDTFESEEGADSNIQDSGGGFGGFANGIHDDVWGLAEAVRGPIWKRYRWRLSRQGRATARCSLKAR